MKSFAPVPGSAEQKIRTPGAAAGRFRRNIPNIISSARLLSTPILVGAIIYNNLPLFKWLLLACLLSDIADGWIARAFDLRSKLGATLDSMADLLVNFIMVGAIFRFKPEFISEHYRPVLLLVVLYVGEHLAALWRYGRLSSFHTVLNRVAAYAQGAFVMTLFLWGYQGWLFLGMVALIVASSLEEFVLLWLLPEWRTDVQGLYWVLSRRGTKS